MLDQALMALVSAAGVALAQAAGTDAWQGFRERVARLFSRGPAPEAAQTVALERLDRTAAELESTGLGGAERAREQVAAAWQTRFQDLLEDLEDADREQAAAQLRELVALAGRAAGGVMAGDEGIAIGGSAHIRAENQAAAAVKMGDVSIGNPPRPGPETEQGRS
ncbi:exodeoxyribonuclease V subunit gamma [Streptomyces purpurogeneiscleroticus]|uniref:exodeoxyribonuclease V subunit gamma n=1 Tax=Streptomyces purpurogeneiscleroticus TaxID=68259 RepID=UPI001CC122D7|nr:exodeoxyribonuclease V subunit gamma [Streptomyces purpurogeneiscleroticus]